MTLPPIKELRALFSGQGISVGVEMSLPWIRNNKELSGHIKQFVQTLIFCLAELGITVRPRFTEMGDDFLHREVSPDTFVFSHHSIGRGNGICRFKQSYRRGYFTLDPEGYSGFARLANDPRAMARAWEYPAEQALAYAANLRSEYLNTNESKFEQPSFSATSIDPGYVFLALQKPGDTVMRLARGNPLEFYQEVVAACRRLGKRCVVKRHPKCTDEAVARLLNRLADLPHVSLSEASINQLITGAERVVVVNSGVGFEALIHAKHVVTFGGCEYASLTSAATDLASVEQCIAAPAYVDLLRIAQFIQFFFEDYCVRADDEERISAKAAECILGHR